MIAASRILRRFLARKTMRIDCCLCVIRDWDPADKPALARIANDRAVWRNLAHRFPHPYTAADADRWFELLGRTPVPTHWAIAVDGDLAGGIGVDLGEGVDAKTGHFGYWLGRAYWGRGIMTAACGVVSDLVLNRFGLVRLEARVFAWNPASMRVLEKCGFEREGVLRRSICKDGEVIDAVLYARVRPDPATVAKT